MNFPSEGIFKEQIQYIDIKSSVLDPILKPTRELKEVRKASYFSSYDVQCALCFHLQTSDQTTCRCTQRPSIFCHFVLHVAARTSIELNIEFN